MPRPPATIYTSRYAAKILAWEHQNRPLTFSAWVDQHLTYLTEHEPQERDAARCTILEAQDTTLHRALRRRKGF